MLVLCACTLAVATSAFSQTMAVDGARAMFSKCVTDFNAGNYEVYLSNFADDFEGYTGVYTPFRFVGKKAWVDFIMGLKNYRAVTYDQRQPSYRAYGENTVLCNAYFAFTTVSNDGIVETQNAVRQLSSSKPTESGWSPITIFRGSSRSELYHVKWKTLPHK